MADAKDPIGQAREAIAADIKTIRRILAEKSKDGRTFEQRLGDAVARDIRGGPLTAHDGLDRTGDAGAGQKNAHSDPTLRHAEARILGRTALEDVVHIAATAAVAHLDDAVRNLKQALRRLEQLDDFTGAEPKIERCELCAQDLHGTGIDADPMYLFTDIAGRLPHNMRVCQWHYDLMRKPPNRRPEASRTIRRYQTGRDRERATA